jgi:subfamily B ATP-binding cassette protein MsbA
MAASESIFELLDQPNETNTGQMTLPSLKVELQFDKVNFRYPNGDHAALENFSLTIPAGQTTALVGHL